ncbi:hypothetical protein SAMN06265365_14825 [Tistlia consotensis]|uniref:Homeodomain-like domain-containing protein n=1 Tax=Tistlia consotensis USBA 355 TaxID=560819 RepID=A0A1Y6CRI6_9PROT|nr:helix-turn-helix domain-containing protein [Tistlia consotensis]SMF82955.1 hypothetical protein SAMN05428998_14826 [Tistlia consotensis USBA 355]SNS31516.1 hypothetical protein SAMN06265365_14825 [Tistlia consotensis]
MTVDFHQILPAELADVAKAAGLEAALKLRKELGGTIVHVPARPRGKELLVRTVGLEAARKIAEAFPRSGEIRVPMGKRLQPALIAHLLAEGRPVQEVARLVGCHAESVRRIKNGRVDSRQADLFDEERRPSGAS